MMNGMELNKDLHFKFIEGTPNHKELQVLLLLYLEIFEDADENFFRQRFHEKERLLSLVVFKEEQPIGFKIGYHYDQETFYSWVGGVLRTFRNQGIAQRLAALQEQWAKKNGYIKLRTKSMNQYKPMMILNLKNGFDIKQVYTNAKRQTKIVFEKGI